MSKIKGYCYLRLDSLIELANILAQQSDFQEILRLVTHKAANLLQAETALIMMINPQTNQTVKTIFTDQTTAQPNPYHFANTNISGWVIKNNQSLLSNNIQKDDRFRKNLFKKTPLKSVMCVPLQSEGSTMGTLLLINKVDSSPFTKEALSYLEKCATIVSPFLRNIQKIQEYFSPPLRTSALLDKYKNLGLLGKSRKHIELLQAIDAASRCDVRTILQGESGTGKELVAKAIHHLSARNSHHFVAVDCGAIPVNLIESELFGHVKGAFTGATTNRTGLLEEANQGTLFMDEIANLPLDLQAKLLRVLQENEIRPLGSNKTKKVDVRIVSATSVDLNKLVAERKFREDLYYRLHVYPIMVPSLNERSEDIPLLTNHFLTEFAKQQHKKIDMLHPDIIDYLQKKPWSGNIRELENFVERMVTLAPAKVKVLDTSILPKENQKEMQKLTSSHHEKTTLRALDQMISDYEYKIIFQALEKNNWNQSKAARALNISEQTMRYKMNKLGIRKNR
jgi:transcriptional regulator with GAF, ATPase, and Fis domain